MIDSSQYQPYVNIYIESIFSEKKSLLEGQISPELREILNNFNFASESTQFDNNTIKYIRVPPQLLVEGKTTVKMDASTNYFANFALNLPEGFKWWYFIPYYGRSVVIDAGYHSQVKNKGVLSRNFTGMIKSIKPSFEFQGTITRIEFECQDMLIASAQQNDSYAIPSGARQDEKIKKAIIASVYRDKFDIKNIFKEYYPNIWTQKFSSMEERHRIALTNLKLNNDPEVTIEQVKNEELQRTSVTQINSALFDAIENLNLAGI